MADQLGRVTVTYAPRSTASSIPLPIGAVFPVASAQFPLLTDFTANMAQDFPVITHRMGSLATLISQRYEVGVSPRRFHFQRSALSFSERAALIAFYNSVQGSLQSFTYAAPIDPTSDPATFEEVRVIFDSPPLSITHLSNMCRVGFDLIECPDADDDALIDGVNSFGVSGAPVTRFASGSLATSLLDQVQVLIPLVTIRVREPLVPLIRLSDRRVTIDGQLYLPRLLSVGEPGSDILMSQDIKGSADTVQFVFGNADRAMSRLNIDTGLKHAQISLSLFHTQSHVLLNLWSGIVTSFSVDGSAQVTMQCSDGLYPITQNYPRRVISRECWKPFNKEIYPGFKPCPWQERSGEGNGASCDYHFNSPNGCLSHGMSTYFGGHPAFPQSVIIHDEGTGHLSIDWSPWMILGAAVGGLVGGVLGGLQRATDKVTSTSIIADNIWGKALPEIYSNNLGVPTRSLWVNATIIATRDESDFQNHLAIVGAGPISQYEGPSVEENVDKFKYLVSPLVNGFPPHGFKTDSQLNLAGSDPAGYGLRRVLGADPAIPATDTFALGQGHDGNQFWLVRDPVYGDVPPFAAGTAFVELRHSKDRGKGITPSSTAAHAMQVPIRFGLSGVEWQPDGTRVDVTGVTNPFWVAVNTYLRALGIQGASSDIQLSSFSLPSLAAPDGSACSQIADLQVPPLIGDLSTTETQYVFQGVIAEFKPYRDWLTEILTCALGFFTFEFGKLRLGIRSNASAVSAFTVGNILYQSLSLTPAESAFEYLKINFANVDLQGQEDYVEYNDKDHAEYFGRSGAPLTSEQRMVGLSSLSQGLRVVSTRVREEIGGILRTDLPLTPYIEWDNNFIVTFKSTLLALDVGVGDVISVTHPDVPTYPGEQTNTWKYRIIKYTIHKDYSTTIVARSVTESMYDLTVGPRPADVLPSPLPALYFAIPRGLAWAPYEVQAAADDALFPLEWTFQLDQYYVTLADGSASAQLVAKGKLPVNHFAPGVGTPSIGSVAVSPLDGVIPPGTTWRTTIVAYNADGLPSPPSEITPIQIPGASGLSWEDTEVPWDDVDSAWGGLTNSFTLSGIVWPKTTGLVSYTVFLSDRDGLICGQQSGSLTAAPDSTYLPAEITVPGPFLRSTYSLPSPHIAKVRVKAKQVSWPGVMHGLVSAVVTDIIVCESLIDDGSGPPPMFDPVGRTLSILGRSITPCPYASFLITAWEPSTGAFTVSPNPEGIVLPLVDQVVIRTLCDGENSGDLTSIFDTGYKNQTNGYFGLTTAAEIGKVIRVIAGTSRGQTRKIFSNSDVQIAWTDDLHLDETSVWIIEDPSWLYSADSTTIDNYDPVASVSLSVPVDNFAGQCLLIAGFTLDANGVESPDAPLGDCPIREQWVFGDPGALGSGVTINDIPVIVPAAP